MTLSNAAEQKFGKIIKMESHPSGDTLFLIERLHPVLPGRDYMTIRGYIQGSNPAFQHGHYDLTYTDALYNFRSRLIM